MYLESEIGKNWQNALLMVKNEYKSNNQIFLNQTGGSGRMHFSYVNWTTVDIRDSD